MARCLAPPMQLPTQAAAPAFSPLEFRAALGMFATGVTIVSARAPTGELVGLTANSFNSVSLDPPLVLWSLSQRSLSLDAFRTGSHYAINVLAADQHELALRFATPLSDRWDGVAWTPVRPPVDSPKCCSTAEHARSSRPMSVTGSWPGRCGPTIGSS